MYELDLLEKYKQKLGIKTDYEAAEALGFANNSFISRVKSGTRHFSDEKIVEMSLVVGIEPHKALIKVHVERAKDSSVRSAWEEAAKKLASVCAVCALGLSLMFTPSNVQAQTADNV